MNKVIPLLAFSILLLVPVSQNAFACGVHGTNSGNDINDWIVTPLSSANQFELRFKNFNTLPYTAGEMCSCALQIASGWNVLSAQLVFAGTNNPVPTFPAFTFDSVISPDLEGDLTALSNPPSGYQWTVLKNTIATNDAGGNNVDLVFTVVFPPDISQSDIIQELEGKQVVAGKIVENPILTGDYQYEPGHFQVLNIIFAVIGGELLPIDATSLILAGAQSFSWMIPVLLSGIGIGLFVVSRKNSLP